MESEAGTSTSNSSREEQMFRCKKCKDGKKYYLSQKEEHREWHRQQRAADQSRRSRGSVRESEPSVAESMFTHVPAPTPGPKITTKKTGEKKKTKKRKIRTKKIYNKEHEQGLAGVQFNGV